MLTNRNRNIGN